MQQIQNTQKQSLFTMATGAKPVFSTPATMTNRNAVGSTASSMKAMPIRNQQPRINRFNAASVVMSADQSNKFAGEKMQASQMASTPAVMPSMPQPTRSRSSQAQPVSLSNQTLASAAQNKISKNTQIHQASTL